MNPQTMIDHFITPALKHMNKVQPGIDSPAARQFMLAVAAQESHCGRYWRQLGGGPARGPWQVEPRTERDVYANYLTYRDELRKTVEHMLPPTSVESPLISCPLYSASIARLVVYRQPDPMPEMDDIDSMWMLYKKFYNSYQGAATREEWDRNWAEFVDGVRV